MKLQKVRVRNFKSIVDSEIVDIEPGVTVVIGKNEQGKTTFLRALASWSPKTNYSPTDLPNHLRHTLERKKAASIPIVTLWVTADPSELKKIGIDDGADQEFECTRFYDGHREYFSIKPNGDKELLKFSPPHFAKYADAAKSAANELKTKLQSHATRHPPFAAHLPQASAQIDQFSSANFNKSEEIDNLIKTFSTAIRSLPEQDAPIQEEVAGIISRIDSARAEIRKVAAIDVAKLFDDAIPNFIFHSTTATASEYVPNEVPIEVVPVSGTVWRLD